MIIALGKWDDEAKLIDRDVPDFSSFYRLITEHLRQQSQISPNV